MPTLAHQNMLQGSDDLLKATMIAAAINRRLYHLKNDPQRHSPSLFPFLTLIFVVDYTERVIWKQTDNKKKQTERIYLTK